MLNYGILICNCYDDRSSFMVVNFFGICNCSCTRLYYICSVHVPLLDLLSSVL